MKDISVVILSSVPWHFTWQRHHDIAHGLAKRGYRVIYVDPLPKRWPSAREISRLIGRLYGNARLSGKNQQRVVEGVEIVLPKTFPDVRSNLGSWINQRVLLPSLLEKIKQKVRGRVVVINYLPTPSSLWLHKALKPDFSIYDCVVDWDTHPTARNTQLVEKELVASSDVILSDSRFLYQKMQRLARGEKPVYRMLPGVHYKDFEEVRKHPPSTPKKESEILCTYFGEISGRLDLELLAKIAERYKLKLIGPIEAEALERLKQAGAEIHPPIPYEQLPESLKSTDVLVLPYNANNPNNKAVIPAKTFQCLATGKPTIAYGLEDLKEFSDVFYLAENHEEFLEKIPEALQDWPLRREKALAIAREQDWEKRIDFLEELWKEALEVTT